MSGEEPKRPNKLHEWGAAILIMAVLTAILAGFLYMLRGSAS
jgi:hypothetical protein